MREEKRKRRKRERGGGVLKYRPQYSAATAFTQIVVGRCANLVDMFEGGQLGMKSLPERPLVGQPVWLLRGCYGK